MYLAWVQNRESRSGAVLCEECMRRECWRCGRSPRDKQCAGCVTDLSADRETSREAEQTSPGTARFSPVHLFPASPPPAAKPPLFQCEGV